ncbi:bifunctional diaminohydroxyphosphoribosylaminopyrimidine deaminase/5-amino-6-(5-phosphoribosylamino)uracil reductase RibD [Rhodospirillum centenum]|uniref:Riboflavin biosynthesis protein RibD n=1 Tax=Rhodospirillum centenum (strain ATCC 51521 / SW) TaxID=414684 RepID=B6IMS8_RHOCS|nr:bifunctional diaminohydroxyphosphoribosylaminopyrimidine deaminase/5-amino-6-(5-phosphoribosylamino)uracil reductase RibD [Rhodospirillum centenum]ACI98744.1 riboflavin biosynthesis protein RibD [Rhodospirillum centenum SW]
MTASPSVAAGRFSDQDRAHMRAALTLAARGLGRVWPNPSVGCVLVREGRVVGRGVTGAGGRPHGETEALRQAGEQARGATAYVSLEPCNHHGRTPPCTEALMAAGVARVVVACEDPDPRVSGGGLARLRAAGLEVASGLLEAEAQELNAGFFLRIREGRPLVTLKLATSLDGRIATRTGESRWITGPVARAWGHGLRASHDAILVGIGTALADDPELTCRLPGMADRSPVRIVLDSRLRLPLTSRLVRTADRTPVWLITRPDAAEPARMAAFADCGVDLIPVEPGPGGEIPLPQALRTLAARGITRVLAEGGARLAASLLRDGLADRLEWFRAGLLLGGDALPAAVGFGADRLADAPRYERIAVRPAGEDLLESYRRRG